MYYYSGTWIRQALRFHDFEGNDLSLIAVQDVLVVDSFVLVGNIQKHKYLS
jgi:hypothetical protein